jgi:hypothetical protein
MSYSVIYLSRRFLYAIVATIAGNFDGGLTLVLVVAISQAYIIYCAHFNPYLKRSANRMELFSETLLVFTFYVIMQCELLNEPHLKYNFGWTGVVLIVVLVLINVVYLLIDPIADVYKRIKLCYYRRKSLKQLEEINKERERRAIESPFSLVPPVVLKPKRIHIR